MTTPTLLNMRNRARQIADYENTQFVTDPELTDIINEGVRELYDWVVEKYEDYYLSTTPPEITLTNASHEIDLDVLIPDFYKMKGIDFKLSSQDWQNMYRYNWRSRNSYNNNISSLVRRGQFVRTYRLVGRKILIQPESNPAGTYRIWYIPLTAALVDDDDEFRGENGWEKYVSLYGAKFIKIKADEDISTIMQEMQIVKDRIDKLGRDRDLEGVQTITSYDRDEFAEWDDYNYY